jgi:nitroreductase/NAD-dependent dihydropyrimidine dehydrogenase PreA subunit
MSLFQVKQGKCKADAGCTICIDECNMALIEMGDGNLPKQIEGAEEICQKCGHCVAVCPHGAISLSNMTPDQCSPVRNDLFLSLEQAEHFFRSRRSVRLFKEQPIDRDILESLITAASYGATGANLQLVNWLIFSEGNDIREMGEITISWMKEFRETLPPCYLLTVLDHTLRLWEQGRDSVCNEAPSMILAHAAAGGTGPWDCIIAMTQLSLAAPTLGLGACWAGWLTFAAKYAPALQEYLSLPEGNSVEGAMMLGYSKHQHPRMPKRNAPSINWR